MSYLGIDLGTSGLKVLLTDDDGQPLASATRNYSVSRPHPGWSEQDPEDWIAALNGAVDDLRRQNSAFSDLQGIAVSGHMHGAMAEAIAHALSSCREHDPRYNIALCGIEFLPQDQLRATFETRFSFLKETFAMLSELSQSEEMPLSAQLLYERILAGLDAEIVWMKRALAGI